MHHRLDHPARRPMAWHRPLIGAGLVVLGAGMVAVRDGRVGGPERAVFHAVNDLPAALAPALWPVLQLGSLLAAPVVALVALVSGHAMLAAALAVVVTPSLRGHWRVLPAAAATLVALGRVYVGAHAPLDVLCGAAGGVAVGAVVDLLVRRRRGARPEEWLT